MILGFRGSLPAGMRRLVAEFGFQFVTQYYVYGLNEGHLTLVLEGGLQCRQNITCT